MTKLKEQQDVNFRLSQYVDKILLTILEKNPGMLEIRWEDTLQEGGKMWLNFNFCDMGFVLFHNVKRW